ncbi:MAG: N-6 DNA methylase [Myxococcales bacterium]|nr:N-6 DNA methylase [Myxococcales bacterium]
MHEPHAWRHEFGLDATRPPQFFADPLELHAPAVLPAQAHVVRRAFDELALDGVLCRDSAPLIYFREVERITPGEAAAIHRLFWNQGVAPILVLIDPEQVHVYSGLARPGATADAPSGFVERMARVPEQLRAFLSAALSGDYFRRHRPAFDPHHRVDRTLLRHIEAARDRLAAVAAAKVQPHTLDALLCRLVFTSYLFDRKVIDAGYLADAGIEGAAHLRDILGRRRRTAAKSDLYALFAQLGQDFNGDLFSADLEAEARQIRAEHIDIVRDFFHGIDPDSGQQAFWPYEFGIIPIETISAIYEHFLKAAGEREKRESGAFYTPRFLAEAVLDLALADAPSLLGKRFLDPSCGSGIFLVGLFNRLAEERARSHPGESYDRRLAGLTAILRDNLRGVDRNRSACLIAAFSLYLAFLDQLAPPDIRRVLKRVRVLPRLVAEGDEDATIRCADLYAVDPARHGGADFIIGNPPWAQARGDNEAAFQWCRARGLPCPSKQMAAAFVWRAPEFLAPGGKITFILPHSLLFNHTPPAIEFQRRLFTSHAVELVLNLCDYQRFLFDDAEAPAVVTRYRDAAPGPRHRVHYWTPKADWAVTQAEILSILPADRVRLPQGDVVRDLAGADAPLVWKAHYWTTPRDVRLLDRLLLYPRLRDILGRRGDRSKKRWIVAEGYEPYGKQDAEAGADKRVLRLPHTACIEATHDLDLFLLRGDVDVHASLQLDLRRSISDVAIFQRPLVLVTEGFNKVAFTDIDVAYRHGIRGIHGPEDDAALLAFLTVYLRSDLARYFLFHTSASWGVSRTRVDIDDLFRLPFPFPEHTHDPARAAEIVAEVHAILRDAMKRAATAVLGRPGIVESAELRARELVHAYFDVNPSEQALIADTSDVVIPSARPTRRSQQIKTIEPATDAQRAQYVGALCSTLHRWSNPDVQLRGDSIVDSKAGVAVVALEKSRAGEPARPPLAVPPNLPALLHRLRRSGAADVGAVELVRGTIVFDGPTLYIGKPLARRFWTRTAALNDADQIAAILLKQGPA